MLIGLAPFILAHALLYPGAYMCSAEREVLPNDYLSCKSLLIASYVNLLWPVIIFAGKRHPMRNVVFDSPPSLL